MTHRITNLTLTFGLLLALSSPAFAKIHRSHAALVAFARVNPCPSTGLRITSCPGYVLDHKTALCAGGADKPSNLQWQKYRESLIKDKAERRQCRLMRLRGIASE